jgi:hypothetical protein
VSRSRYCAVAARQTANSATSKAANLIRVYTARLSAWELAGRKGLASHNLLRPFHCDKHHMYDPRCGNSQSKGRSHE